MRIAMFYHSLLSDWNHGSAHFLRGVVSELKSRGHEVRVYEPVDSWSMTNLLAEHGFEAVHRFRAAYPGLDSVRYELETLDLAGVCKWADLLIVHEWNEPKLVAALGECRRNDSHFRLLFHDTHHRSATDRAAMSRYDLRHYDAVLAFGDVIRDIYLQEGWAAKAYTWHEAADTRLFKPIRGPRDGGEIVWIGNWGDEERSEELREFLLDPVRNLCIRASAFGVRYPPQAKAALDEAGIRYGGWLPNFDVPKTFARFHLTVHIPRRPYVQALPGVPTIRPFEAMACGIPLICSPWKHPRGFFTPGEDYLIARDGQQMQQHMQTLLNDPAAAQQLAEHGRSTILARHTCAHRVDELFEICRELKLDKAFGPLAARRTASADSRSAAAQPARSHNTLAGRASS